MQWQTFLSSSWGPFLLTHCRQVLLKAFTMQRALALMGCICSATQTLFCCFTKFSHVFLGSISFTQIPPLSFPKSRIYYKEAVLVSICWSEKGRLQHKSSDSRHEQKNEQPQSELTSLLPHKLNSEIVLPRVTTLYIAPLTGWRQYKGKKQQRAGRWEGEKIRKNYSCRTKKIAKKNRATQKQKVSKSGDW